MHFEKYLLSFLPTWYFYHLMEYIIHTLSHNRKYGSYIYRAHLNHHKVYPISQFSGKLPFKYSKIVGIPETFCVYFPFIVIITIGFRLLLPYDLFIFVCSETYLLLFISDYIHTQIHIDGSWLETYPTFMKLRKYHYLHHLRRSKNMSLSGLDTIYDQLFDTYLPIQQFW